MKPGRKLLVHGYTGAYDEVSSGIVAYLNSKSTDPVHKPLYGKWKEDTFDLPLNFQQPTPEILEELETRGYLTALSPEEELEYFRTVARQIHLLQSQYNSYVIVPTYNCNLRCPYCFQDAMRTDPKYKHLLVKMTPKVADRILTGIDEIENKANGNGNTAHRYFTFFGGEPLLASNVDIIEYVIQQALMRGPTFFSAITNGTELEAFENLLGPGLIARLQITLDGPPQIHDSLRTYSNKEGSFEDIARNITMALDRNVAISVRINVSKNTIEGLPKLVREAKRRGWTQYKKFRIYAAPIHPTSAYQAAAENLFANTRQLTVAIIEMCKKNPEMELVETTDDAIKKRALSLFKNPELDPIETSKASFCGAHNGMWIFDPLGDIYACWERLGNPQIRIGHIGEKGEIHVAKSQLEIWRGRTVTSNEVCEKCQFALNCGGGCAIMAEARNGVLNSNYCDAFASRFKSAVATAYEENIHEKNRQD